jgi:hypothetical protein
MKRIETDAPLRQVSELKKDGRNARSAAISS